MRVNWEDKMEKVKLFRSNDATVTEQTSGKKIKVSGDKLKRLSTIEVEEVVEKPSLRKTFNQ